MPLAVEFDRRRQWVLVRGRDEVTLQDVVTLITTVRSQHEYRMWPMLCDLRDATTTMTEQDVETAVAAVQNAMATQGPRAHVAIAVTDDQLYARLLLYETRCAEIGARMIRVFRQLSDAERWLEILSATRHFG